MTKYSVLMSVYSKEKPEYLRKSIESMLSQTVLADEFIIVKDGPLTDELDKVIDYFTGKNKELFTIIALAENGGLGRALNYGLKASRNELIARMDSDDISKPERCEKQLEKFAIDPELVVCGTQIDEFLDSPDNIVSSRIVPCDWNEIKIFARRRSPYNHPTVMYKKSKVLEAGGYGEYGRKEDLDLFLRMIFSGCKGANLHESLLLYRTNMDNIQRRKTWKNCSEYVAVMHKFCKKGCIGFGDMAYVVIGQLTMYIMPAFIVKGLSDRLLRKKS